MDSHIQHRVENTVSKQPPHGTSCIHRRRHFYQQPDRSWCANMAHAPIQNMPGCPSGPTPESSKRGTDKHSAPLLPHQQTHGRPSGGADLPRYASQPALIGPYSIAGSIGSGSPSGEAHGAAAIQQSQTRCDIPPACSVGDSLDDALALSSSPPSSCKRSATSSSA